VSAHAQPRDYAAAIYDLALEAWSRELGRIQETLRQDAALRTILDDPDRSTQDKLQQLTTAVPLTTAEEDTLRANLAKRFGSDLEFEFKVDAALIGGVHLRVGDQVIDGSVAGKLASLRDSLAA
jgi:F0F1-type ATP synthase delta subunit